MSGDNPRCDTCKFWDKNERRHTTATVTVPGYCFISLPPHVASNFPRYSDRQTFGSDYCDLWKQKESDA